MPDWLATSILLETAHRNLADAARKCPTPVDDALVHDAIQHMERLSKNARRIDAQERSIRQQHDGRALATQRSQERVAAILARGGSLKTNIGDPNPKGPSNKTDNRKRK